MQHVDLCTGEGMSAKADAAFAPATLLFPADGPSFSEKKGVELLAAVLRYNGLSPAEGFEEFADEHGCICLDDFIQTVSALQLGLDKSGLAGLFRVLDVNACGMLSRDGWVQTLQNIDSEKVLRDRGVAIPENAREKEIENAATEPAITSARSSPVSANLPSIEMDLQRDVLRHSAHMSRPHSAHPACFVVSHGNAARPTPYLPISTSAGHRKLLGVRRHAAAHADAGDTRDTSAGANAGGEGRLAGGAATRKVFFFISIMNMKLLVFSGLCRRVVGDLC
jgi:hypothetical protein